MPDKKITFTPSQLTAIDSRNTPASIEAGAGSGKTTVLINRTIDILDNNKDIKLENILLITFTENAVMDIKKKLMNKFDEKSSVYTFHGFANLILHDHPALLGVDPSFSILDEKSATCFYKESFYNYIKLISGEHIPESFDNFILSNQNLYTETTELLKHFTPQSLFKLIIMVYKSRHEFLIKKDLDTIIENYLTFTSEKFLKKYFESVKLNNIFKSHMENLENIKSLDPLDKLTQIKDEYLSFFKNFTPDRETIEYKLPPLRGGSKKNFSPGDFEKLKSSLSYLKKLFDKMNGNHFNSERNKLSFELSKNFFNLYKNFELFLGRKKNSLNKLDFSDLEILTQKIINYKFIKNYYSSKYKYILVDEFQDTSLIQKRLIYALFPLEKLIIVGDPKQSIYKFRNADVSLFSEVSKDLSSKGKKIVLNTNFRSQNNLLYFFNTIFDYLFNLNHSLPLSEKEEVLASLTNLSSSNVSPQSLWEQDFLNKESQGKIDIKTILKVEKENINFFEFEADIVADQILYYLENGENLRDIAILLHSTTHANDIESSLKSRLIPYTIIDSSGFFETHEVYEIVNFLKFLFSPKDDLAFVATLKSSFFDLSDQNLIDFFENSGHEFFFDKFKNYCTNDSHFSSIKNYLNEMITLAASIPVYELTSKLTKNKNFKNYILKSNSPHQKLANIEKLLGFIDKFASEKGFKTFNDWITYFDNLKSKDLKISEASILDSDEDCIKIMTVHKSKGLEFENVIIPYCKDNIISKPAEFLFNKELPTLKTYENEETFENILHFTGSLENYLSDAYESIRLFYVALTRAKRNIAIIGKESKNEISPSLSSNWIDFIIHILDLSKKESGKHLHESKLCYLDSKNETIIRNVKFPYNYQKIDPNTHISAHKKYINSSSNKEIMKKDFSLPSIDPKNILVETSVVALQHYINCPYYYFLRYVANISEDIFSTSGNNFISSHCKSNKTIYKGIKPNVRGQIIHKLFENFASKSFTEDLIPEALHKASEYFGETFSEDEHEILLDQTKKSYNSDYFSKLKTSHKTFVERPFLLKLKSKIKGTIDRVDLWDHKIVITDYKSGIVSKTEDEKTKFSIQAGIYAIAVSKIFPSLPIEFNFFFTQTQECLIMKYGEKELLDTQTMINDITDKIASNIFPKNFNACKNCLLSGFCKLEDK